MFKYIVVRLVFIFACLLSVLTQAQSSRQDSQPALSYADQAARVLSVFRQSAAHLSNCNIDAQADFFHPNITYWPSTTVKPIYGVDDIKTAFQSLCDHNPQLRFTIDSTFVDVLGDTAAVSGLVQYRLMLNDKLSELPFRFSFTMVQEDSEWKIFHAQSVMMPFDPSTTDALRPKTP